MKHSTVITKYGMRLGATVNIISEIGADGWERVARMAHTQLGWLSLTKEQRKHIYEEATKKEQAK